jgi:hypothetical protein
LTGTGSESGKKPDRLGLLEGAVPPAEGASPQLVPAEITPGAKPIENDVMATPVLKIS